jgi:glyoxylase-like metal-dependent hydrolase (beta-lactamase superfamily II)
MPLLGLAPLYAETRVDVGGKEVISLSDGNLVLPGSMFFEGLPKAELEPILTEYGISRDELRPPCNLTLLRDEDRLIMFDTGSGAHFMPSAGQILQSLETVGVTPEDITHVVFTHAHPDHLWGVLDDFDDIVFPQAQHMIAQSEWAYWTDPNTVNAIGELRKTFAVGAERRLAQIAEHLTFFQDGEEVLPGVMAHETHGHTPGHTSFEVRDGTSALMIGGDAIVNHHVAFARPEWPSGSDQDPEMGAITRARLLDKLVADDIALLGFHLPDGGLGRVERSEGGYRFLPQEV